MNNLGEKEHTLPVRQQVALFHFRDELRDVLSEPPVAASLRVGRGGCTKYKEANK